MHTPVLLEEVLQYLALAPGKFVIDGTVNGGGHAKAILEKVKPDGKLLGIDWDERVLAKSKERMANSENIVLVHGNYADLPEILAERNLPNADGLLLDLGFSSEQLDMPRGFSFERDEPLLMTYDGSREPVAVLLRKTPERELVRIIRDYGEERYAMRIARAIAMREKQTPILTSKELAETVFAAVPGNYERGRIHPATRTFQALRIYANGELENLRRVILELPKIVRVGGRVVIISFHSLEDRIVKTMFREMAAQGALEIITKKPVTASEEEIAVNPRSRSAKLRAARIAIRT
ncbi:MAG: 16S rRNA (cytosine(1402)-N(4))-methyltransferase RsmH [Candidatus Liptonbacteria bacterium]|nr:16S rRNA (cytosine(1402)-N(4))-methyltransferase RsmH [Candidatus Liptonbacteria bacterium]